MKFSLSILPLAGIVTVLSFTACGTETKGTCDETLTCAVADAGGDVIAPPAGCDPAADPKDAPKCVVDEFGIFVDATGGSDSNAGTKESPTKTINGALTKLGAKNRVYVCEGSYAEHVKLTSPVSIYAGFACGGWSYTGAKAKVAPRDAGYALEVASVAAPATVADISFTAAAGTDAAASSVAAFVKNTPSLTLLRVALTAGSGFKGKTPNKGTTLALVSSTPTAGTLNGNAGNATVGGAAQLCTCVGGGTSKGGGGGNLNGDGSPGETVQAVPDPTTATGAQQTFDQCKSGTQSARPGSNAPPAAGAAGAASLGVLSDNGWSPSSGLDAAAGTPGQGGGGGGGADGGGGSGACGGCGGEGGRGGGGGGASIALATIGSPVSLVSSALTTADAGPGGSGGAGGDGAAGGTKGARGGAACDGGNGGAGGSGGGGGGGAGGISVGILYKGAKPSLGTSTITTGAFGPKGVGAGLDGIDGQKADTLEAK